MRANPASFALRIILLGHVGTPAGSQLGDLVALALRPSLLLADGFEPGDP